MKCKRCGDRAVAEMRQHRMALCRPCYLDWFVRYTAKTIKKFDMLRRDERLLVAVSGGKDSAALWTVLSELGYQVDGMVIDLGIGDDGKAGRPGEGYSADSTDFARRLGERLQRPLWVIDLREYLGRTVPELKRGQRPVCSACGLVKRYFMNRVAFEGGYDGIATGHNLDDEVSALFGNVLSWDRRYLSRQGPVAEQRGGRLMKKVKPFIYFTERETAMYSILAGIPYIHDECPNAVGATTITYKELINRLESDAPGTKRRFYDGFLDTREVFEDPHDAGMGEATAGDSGPGDADQGDDGALSTCGRCGMPSPLEVCGFCRMVGDVPITRFGALEEIRPPGTPEPRTATASRAATAPAADSASAAAPGTAHVADSRTATDADSPAAADANSRVATAAGRR